MISREEAFAIATANLGSASGLCDLVVTGVMERELSWVVGFNTRQYVETADILHAIFGSGPMVISKATGQVARTDSHPPVLDRISEAEKTLGIEGED